MTVVGCPSNAHLQVWCPPTPLHHLSLLHFVLRVCINRSRFRNSQHNQQATAHIRSWRHIQEGCSRLSVECTPHLLSISSSPSPLFAKLSSTCAHRSVKNLEIYRIISRPVPVSYSIRTLGMADVGCPSNAHIQLWCLPSPLHHICLLNFVPRVCTDPFKIQKFTA